uniref:Uncharacterized protein n=1 Tax=Timema poppense TaxID=170557 RepID=A0A7R9H5Y0_TIMPO|nr:unnamed protein product [Timema poppensis]
MSLKVRQKGARYCMRLAWGSIATPAPYLSSSSLPPSSLRPKSKIELHNKQSTDNLLKSSNDAKICISSPTTSNNTTSIVDQLPSASLILPASEEGSKIKDPCYSRPTITNELDLGLHIQTGKQVTHAMKKELLENVLTPDLNFSFPSSGTRKLKFQSKWLGNWNWLVSHNCFRSAFLGLNVTKYLGHDETCLIVAHGAESPTVPPLLLSTHTLYLVFVNELLSGDY